MGVIWLINTDSEGPKVSCSHFIFFCFISPITFFCPPHILVSVSIILFSLNISGSFHFCFPVNPFSFFLLKFYCKFGFKKIWLNYVCNFFYLVFLFGNESDQWALVTDQNILNLSCIKRIYVLREIKTTYSLEWREYFKQ
jgi:hypothetical protein